MKCNKIRDKEEVALLCNKVLSLLLLFLIDIWMIAPALHELQDSYIRFYCITVGLLRTIATSLVSIIHIG